MVEIIFLASLDKSFINILMLHQRCISETQDIMHVPYSSTESL